MKKEITKWYILIDWGIEGEAYCFDPSKLDVSHDELYLCISEQFNYTLIKQKEYKNG